MQSEHVQAILSGVSRSTLPAPQTVSETIVETIIVPREIARWKASEEEQGRAFAVQADNRERFQKAFARRLAVIGFRTDAEGNGIFELGHWHEPKF
jgi:hypothetical protein